MHCFGSSSAKYICRVHPSDCQNDRSQRVLNPECRQDEEE